MMTSEVLLVKYKNRKWVLFLFVCQASPESLHTGQVQGQIMVFYLLLLQVWGQVAGNFQRYPRSVWTDWCSSESRTVQSE